MMQTCDRLLQSTFYSGNWLSTLAAPLSAASGEHRRPVAPARYFIAARVTQSLHCLISLSAKPETTQLAV